MTTISMEELAAVHSSAHNKTIDCLETLLNEIVSKRSNKAASELSALQKENAELASISECQMGVAKACIELLHDGCPIPNPSTGDAEPFQANPQNAIDAINKLRAKLLERGITL